MYIFIAFWLQKRTWQENQTLQKYVSENKKFLFEFLRDQWEQVGVYILKSFCFCDAHTCYKRRAVLYILFCSLLFSALCLGSLSKLEFTDLVFLFWKLYLTNNRHIATFTSSEFATQWIISVNTLV